MVYRVGNARADDGEVIDVLGDVWQPVGNPKPALAVLLERPTGRKQSVLVRTESGHSKSLGMERWRDLLARVLYQFRLGIEEINMARPAFHETEDDGFRPRCDVWRLGIERVGSDSRASIFF